MPAVGLGVPSTEDSLLSSLPAWLPLTSSLAIDTSTTPIDHKHKPVTNTTHRSQTQRTNHRSQAQCTNIIHRSQTQHTNHRSQEQCTDTIHRSQTQHTDHKHNPQVTNHRSQTQHTNHKHNPHSQLKFGGENRFNKTIVLNFKAHLNLSFFLLFISVKEKPDIDCSKHILSYKTRDNKYLFI